MGISVAVGGPGVTMLVTLLFFLLAMNGHLVVIEVNGR